MSSFSSKRPAFKKPSSFSTSKIDEEIVEEESQPRFPGGAVPKPRSGVSKFTRSPTEDDEETQMEVVEEERLTYDPRGKSMTRGHRGATPINSSAMATNSKLKVNETLKTSQKYPYLIDAAEYDGSQIMLYDIDSKRILLTYQGDIDMETVEKTPKSITKSSYSFDTPDGPKKGYVFWKNSKPYIECLDNIFTPAWRDSLKIPLPEVTVANPEFLWEGMIDGVEAQIAEYSEKAICLYTEAEYDFKDFDEKFHKRWKHPTGELVMGYVVGKKSKIIDKLREMVDYDFPQHYTKSPPVFSKPIAKVHEPAFVKKKVMVSEGETYTIKLYDYSTDAYAVILEPHTTIDSQSMKEGTVTINSKKVPAYIAAKSSKSAREDIESLLDIDLDEHAASVMENTLAQKIPAASSSKTFAQPKKVEPQDLILQLLTSLQGVQEGQRREIFDHGEKRVVIYGPNGDMEEMVGNESDSELIFQGSMEEFGFAVFKPL